MPSRLLLVPSNAMSSQCPAPGLRFIQISAGLASAVVTTSIRPSPSRSPNGGPRLPVPAGATASTKVPEYGVVLLHHRARQRLGQHISAAHEKILPSVVVEVVESRAKSCHPHAQRAHAARRGHFLEPAPGRVLP